MFEYDLLLLKVYGFTKINYIDESKLEFKYKNRVLIVRGSNLKILNLFDKTVEIHGVIERLEIVYKGAKHD